MGVGWGGRGCWWGWGLQGHYNGTLLIVLSAYANHQLSVSGREGTARRHPKTRASYLTCAVSRWAHSNTSLKEWRRWRDSLRGREREREHPNWLIMPQIDVKRHCRYGPSYFLIFFLWPTWLFEGIVLPIMARTGGVSEPLWMSDWMAWMQSRPVI